MKWCMFVLSFPNFNWQFLKQEAAFVYDSMRIDSTLRTKAEKSKSPRTTNNSSDGFAYRDKSIY